MSTKTFCQMVVIALAAVALAGCATGGKGPSDEEQIQALVAAWKAAVIAKNTDAIMATCSEAFSHAGYEYDAADKAALREFVDDCDDMGYFDDVEISCDGASTAIDGASATVTGIEFSNNQGSVTVDLVLKKEKAGWLITDMTIHGL